MESRSQRAGGRSRSVLEDFLENKRLTIVASVLGPQRFSIRYPGQVVSVQMNASSVEVVDPLFSFRTPEGCVVTGAMNGPLGIMHRNERRIATIEPDDVPTRKRLMLRARSVKIGTLCYGEHPLPISCSLWMGVIGTDFVIRNTDQKHIAVWKRWGARTRLLISANVPPELADAIIGTVLYTEIDKDISC